MFATVFNRVRFALILVEMTAWVAFGAWHAFAGLDFIDVFAFGSDAFGLEALVFYADAAGTRLIAVTFSLVVDHLACARHPTWLL